MRLSIFQSAGGGISLEQRLERLDEAIAAHADRPDLVLCPELFASVYSTPRCRGGGR